MLSLLDITFTLSHWLLIGFNLSGWAWKRTRKWHLVVLILTAASWFVLGIWYGWGYCPLTSWHWDIKERLGETGLPNSFIKYHADKWLDRDIPAVVVDRVTLAGLGFAVVAALYVNFFAGRLKRRDRR
jgi:hypothetical protein